MDTSFRIDVRVTTAEVPGSGYTIVHIQSQVVKRIIFGDWDLFGITFDINQIVHKCEMLTNQWQWFILECSCQS